MIVKVPLEATATVMVAVDVPDDTPADELEEVAVRAAVDEVPAMYARLCMLGRPWRLDFGDFLPPDDVAIELPTDTGQ